jgi:hypothetical protein
VDEEDFLLRYDSASLSSYTLFFDVSTQYNCLVMLKTEYSVTQRRAREERTPTLQFISCLEGIVFGSSHIC